ncbi:MAG: PAS domain-containing protein, partial [Deltaproteobacteria bacterium]|nr:PAS domain-containing protein [Deltaproteobacteria bacterium]
MARELQSVLDAVLDGILLIDRDGCVEDVNTEACRIFGVSAESIRGISIDKLIDPRRAIVDLARRVVETGQPFVQDEVVFERRNGPSLSIDVSVSPIFDAELGSTLDGAVVVIRDRTITNSLREIVNQQEQLASYGLIAAGIAHEVKNPLGGIRGAAELIERWSGDDRSTRAAALIVREVDRISDLVEELMVFARGEELSLAPVNAHQILDSVIELVRLDPLSEGIVIERAYDPSIPEIMADADRLQQVFLNLVRNALQAMKAGTGRLQIETRMTLDQRLTGKDLTSIPTVQVVIRDNGSGISPEVFDRLATPFFTTRQKGTGLGLAVSRHWVNRHHGTLKISSPPGEGTTVRVNLPLEPVKD